jgi:DNA replication and repair protein RecF
MTLRRLRLKNFRAHTDTTIVFGNKINVVTGPNGAGKTNLLEAIHYLCLTKSFLTSNDRYVVQNGCDFFDIEADLEASSSEPVQSVNDSRDSSTVRLTCVPKEGKKLFVNGAPLDRLTEIVGRYPIVIHSPGDYVLTSEGPEERRRFLNNVLSQSRPVYLADLMKYRRTLRQRNVLLARRSNLSTLESWTEELVTTGARLILARRQFIEGFGVFLSQAYNQLAEIAEEPTIEYRTVDREDPGDNLDDIAAFMRQRILKSKQLELERGRTLIGPHHDELMFRLNGLEVRRYGSQGQHRTFAMALKIGQYFYLRDRLDALPVLLLDDAFAHLDERRTLGFLRLLESDEVGQTIITAASDHYFDGRVDTADSNNRFFTVENGVVRVVAIA